MPCLVYDTESVLALKSQEAVATGNAGHLRDVREKDKVPILALGQAQAMAPRDPATIDKTHHCQPGAGNKNSRMRNYQAP